MELYQAHNQWSKRPQDERFNSLQSLYDATRHYADIAVEREGISWANIRTEAVKSDVMLVGRKNQPAQLTNWAFGQLSSRLQSPAGFLRSLPATLACQVLNHKLSLLPKEQADANVLFQANGSLLVRSITSEKYSRIWNWEVAERLLDLEVNGGWAPARPTFRCGENEPPALYASDHDMFAFVTLPNVTLEQPVGHQGAPPLYKGLIYSNSEVGAASLTCTSFWYNAMCGNHIIWGASGVVELNARHIGTVRDRMQSWNLSIRKFADASASEDQAHIERAANVKIAATKEQLLDTLFGKRSLGMSRKAIDASYEACIPEQDGDPRTIWGWVQGATRYSQTVPYTDERTKIDRAAARVLAMSF